MKSHKIKVIFHTISLFQLSHKQAESFANKAGLSLYPYIKSHLKAHEFTNLNCKSTENAESSFYPHSKLQTQEQPPIGLAKILEKCSSGQRRKLYHLAVSERMIQYYLAGKVPTKQALLAIGILLELPAKELEELLWGYGYSLSYSLANDAAVRWFLEDKRTLAGTDLLYEINEALEYLNLPLLMTKQIRR